MQVDEGNSVLISKLVSGSVLFLASTVCGLLPFKLAKLFKWLDQNEKDKKPSLMVNILLSFGGGVLIATTFLHLLPDISLTIDWLKSEGLIPQLGFSLPEFLMMVGFFLIYLVEELVHNYLHRHQRKKKIEAEMKNKLTETYNKSIDKTLEIVQNSSHNHGHSHILPLPHSEEEDILVSSLRGLLIVLALSIHELFEGFAVGLMKTSKGVYFMFAAVCAHKFVIAFCVGIELIVQKTKPWLALVYILVYSGVSAIGEFYSIQKIVTFKFYIPLCVLKFRHSHWCFAVNWFKRR